MSLLTDKQTLEDLNIFGKRGSRSVYTIFNHTHTAGGAEALELLFRFPLNDAIAINDRSNTIRYFKESVSVFPFRSELFDAAERYIANKDERSRLVMQEKNLEWKLNKLMGPDLDREQLLNGISALTMIFIQLDIFLEKIIRDLAEGEFCDQCNAMKRLLSEMLGNDIAGKWPSAMVGYNEAVELDGLFRFTHHTLVTKILGFIYQIDAFISIAFVAAQKGFAFAEAFAPESHKVDIKGIWHPEVRNAVRNDVYIGADKNVVFLTGANMAGKSTFMKSLGVAMFLAHAGMPVAAESMKFSVCDALLTTINLPDDLTSGHSHFYTEVLRVKKMAALLKNVRNLFVIFDELFRGTNVKDAYDATVAVTAAFAERTNCMFVVSTHIIEAGEALQSISNRISYIYLPTLINEGQPVYPRKIQSGITADRHGMAIIQQEGILEILRNGIK